MESFPIIAVIGPTSSGKSALAVRLARKLVGGEIISADSRQVYKGLNIGSGKITKLEKKGVPHHLLDVVSPKRTFTVSQYQKLAEQAIADIIRRGKVPIICGGAGFYIDALRGRVSIPPAAPNPSLRAKLGKLSTEKLFEKLETLDKTRAENIDRHNRHRLIRAIEIAQTNGKRADHKGNPWETKGYPLYPKADWLMLGIEPDPDELRKKINTRLKFRIKHGLLAEVKKLHQNGLSWKRLESFGLEYRQVSRYLQNLITKEQMARELETAIWRYAKRQITWFKRDKTICWIKNYQEAKKLTMAFLKKSGKIEREGA